MKAETQTARSRGLDILPGAGQSNIYRTYYGTCRSQQQITNVERNSSKFAAPREEAGMNASCLTHCVTALEETRK